jgi:hypothetical protein
MLAAARLSNVQLQHNTTTATAEKSKKEKLLPLLRSLTHAWNAIEWSLRRRKIQMSNLAPINASPLKLSQVVPFRIEETLLFARRSPLSAYAPAES